MTNEKIQESTNSKNSLSTNINIREITKKVEKAIQKINKINNEKNEYEIRVEKFSYKENKYWILLSKDIRFLTGFTARECEGLARYMSAKYDGVYCKDGKLKARFSYNDAKVEK